MQLCTCPNPDVTRISKRDDKPCDPWCKICGHWWNPKRPVPPPSWMPKLDMEKIHDRAMRRVVAIPRAIL